MSNRWLRFGIAFLALVAAAAAGYRIYQQEQRLTATLQTTRSTDGVAESALMTISEIKAALHAYVAEGQGHAFWTARAASLIEALRASLLELDGAASAAGGSLAETLTLADRLKASEQRARDHVRGAERLLAGEVIFTDARDVLDAMRLQLARSRTQIADAAAVSEGGIRREQTMLGVGAAGILAFALLLLAIPGSPEAASPPAAQKTAAGETPDEFGSSARLVSRAPLKPQAPATSAARPAAAASTAAAPQRNGQGLRTAGSSAAALPADKSGGAATNGNTNGKSSESLAAEPTVEPGPNAAIPSLREAAVICTELGRASQSVEVSNLLARAAKVLDASGAVVWIASADGRELLPAASAGYEERLLARIGAIPRSANNVTASAVRSGSARTSPRAGQSAAALAIPLLTPLGAVGVLSAEFKNVAEVDETRLAIATIFAAQLASLVGSRTTAQADAAAVSANSVPR